MSRTSAKINARYLQYLLKEHGCRRIVISPGSRNAPLIIALSKDEHFECISVPDERSAAFVALGMTLENRQPAAVICSSGSAAVNFYPAVTEAFYQRLPLLLITADRPLEMIDQGVGQAIRQTDLFENHIGKSVNLLRAPQDNLQKNYNQRLINEAMHALSRGPVHINVPFDEPLYDTVDEQEAVRFIAQMSASRQLSSSMLQEITDIWQKSGKIMLLAGQMPENPSLNEILQNLYQHSPYLLLHESVSNLSIPESIVNIDRLISGMSTEEEADLKPDLLITFGGEIVSKRIRSFLSRNRPTYHLHLDEQAQVKDTFQALTHLLPLNASEFFRQLLGALPGGNNTYSTQWLKFAQGRLSRHDAFLAEAPYSDLTVYRHLLTALPDQSILHLANSTSIRYAQLFESRKTVLQYANRGTSGIDGCLSTAAGHALTVEKPLTLICGDIAFFYDANGLWMDPLPANLRIVLINNQGGNIFRIIEGPEKDGAMARYQETHHQLNGRGIAETFGLKYRFAKDEKALVNLLPDFFAQTGPSILEIFTPREESPEILNNYFKYLKNGSN